MSDADATRRGLALAFLERFCAGDVDGLASLLAPDLEFRGPLLECDSAADYLARLRRDPPQPGCTCKVLDLAEAGDTVVVSWEYQKPTGAVRLTQHIRIRGGRIAAMSLSFDAAGR